MNASTVTRYAADNRIIVIRPCAARAGFDAYVKQGGWSAWQGGFKSSEDALSWAESVERETTSSGYVDNGEWERTPNEGEGQGEMTE